MRTPPTRTTLFPYTTLFRSSRMGMFSFLATLLFLALVVKIKGSQRKIAATFMLGITALVVGGALWIGVDSIVQRRSEEHTSELQSRLHLVCRLLLEKKKNKV